MTNVSTIKITTCKWSFLFLLCVLSVSVQAEVINDFSATYTIQADGAVQVREVIDYDFEDASRRGIFRTLEIDHPQPATQWFRERTIAIDVLGVTQDGNQAQYERIDDTGEVTIKIGNPDIYITGAHRYEILYVLRGALSYGTDGAELYYNVTGNRWPVPIARATAVVVGARSGLLASQSSCYEGTEGATAACAGITGDAGISSTFTSGPLGPGTGLTIAQEINAAQVSELVIEEWQWVWLVIPISLALIAILTIAIYRRHTANKPNQPVIAHYEPYGNLLPMYTGVVFDGRLDPYDITAGIVYLAEQGFIKIKHTEKTVLGVFTSNDYELTLLRPPVEAPNEPQQVILSWIFATSTTTTAISVLDSIRISLLSGAAPSVESVEVGKKITLSALAARTLENTLATQNLQKLLRARFVAEGYQETPSSLLGMSRGLLIGALIFVMFGSIVAVVFLGSPFPLLFMFVATVLVVAIFIPRRTRKGYEALYHLLGFKDFLSVTDKERFDFHNAPEKSPELFMKYLPYAIALKVEDKWAKAFAGITMPNPDWYEGSAGLATFSAAAFTSDLSTFASSFNASSGTSGSSGGGSSGGGGGGGGGGSW